MSETVRELIGHGDVRRIMLSDKVYKVTEASCSSPETIIGLELEIESWGGRTQEFQGFDFTEDGSLRNMGIEAISRPTKSKFVENLLSTFFKNFGITDDNYSERCSTHVHVNVLDFTLEQLASLALIYQVTERLLFGYVSPERKSNIFCVPWCQADSKLDLVSIITTGKWRELKAWSKYTALNLLAVTQRGTVEYRHLEGSCDVQHIMGWINLLGCLHNYAKETPVEKIKAVLLDINTSSAYDMFLQSVFGKHTSMLFTPDYRVDLEAGVIDAKLLFTKGLPTGENALQRYVRAMEQAGLLPEDNVMFQAGLRPEVVQEDDIVEDDDEREEEYTTMFAPVPEAIPARPEVRMTPEMELQRDAVLDNLANTQRFFTPQRRPNPVPIAAVAGQPIQATTNAPRGVRPRNRW